MHRLKHQIAILINHIRLATGISTPQHIHQVLPLGCQSVDGSVGEHLPAYLRVAIGLMGTHGERGIKQQHPLLCPATQIARGGDGSAQIVLYLLES